MSEKDHLYVLVRVRKSGSQSLVKIMQDALPDCTTYPMPHDPPEADLGVGLWESFRLWRRQKKRLKLLFSTKSYSRAWELLNERAKPNDLIGGHFPYGTPQLPKWELRYVTLMRDPLRRLYSEYRYCRQSYEQRSVLRRLYCSARIRVAGKGGFADYIAYLDEQGDRFANPLVAYITNGDDAVSPYEFLRKNYFHYGLLERMDQFADQLSAKMGREVSAVWQNKTKDSGAIELEDYDEGMVQRLIGRDISLYQSVLRELQDAES